MSKKIYKFGLKKSEQEPIERLLCFNHQQSIDIPVKFNLKDKVKQIYDQSDINACSSCATASLLSIIDNISVSRLYLYFCTRWLDNKCILPIEDQGATIKNVFKSINDYKYITEDKYPYFTHLVNDIPYKHIFEEAFTNKCPILSYRQIMPSNHTLNYILYKLHIPILFGMS